VNDRTYHCDLCMCPIEFWEPLKTFKSDRSCDIFSDVSDVIWELEERIQYNFSDVLEKCLKFTDMYPDIEDFTATIKEICEIQKDCGVITDKYLG